MFCMVQQRESYGEAGNSDSQLPDISTLFPPAIRPLATALRSLDEQSYDAIFRIAKQIWEPSTVRYVLAENSRSFALFQKCLQELEAVAGPCALWGEQGVEVLRLLRTECPHLAINTRPKNSPYYRSNAPITVELVRVAEKITTFFIYPNENNSSSIIQSQHASLELCNGQRAVVGRGDLVVDEIFGCQLSVPARLNVDLKLRDPQAKISRAGLEVSRSADGNCISIRDLGSVNDVRITQENERIDYDCSRAQSVRSCIDADVADSNNMEKFRDSNNLRGAPDADAGNPYSPPVLSFREKLREKLSKWTRRS